MIISSQDNELATLSDHSLLARVAHGDKVPLTPCSTVTTTGCMVLLFAWWASGRRLKIWRKKPPETLALIGRPLAMDENVGGLALSVAMNLGYNVSRPRRRMDERNVHLVPGGK